MAQYPYVKVVMVPERAVGSSEPYDLVSAVIHFFNYLTRDGALRRDDFPREVLMSYHVDYYLAQVNNGGHEQFVANSGWQSVINDDIELGLERSGASSCLALFKEVRAYVDESDTRLKAMKARGGFSHTKYGDPDTLLGEKDRQFFALNRGEEDLVRLNHTFIRSMQVLSVVPDSALKSSLDDLIVGNPLREKRLAELDLKRREQQAQHARRVHLLSSLCREVGRNYQTNSPMLTYGTEHDGRPCNAYVVATDQGRVALIEVEGAAILTTFPEGAKLAAIEVKDTADS